MKVVFLVSWLISFFPAQGQPGYGVNDQIAEFKINNILNYSSPAASFSEWNDKLLIIDFFGTWCTPCIKALPKLAALQATYEKEIRILLVSEETPETLKKFISKQISFHFPVVVDQEKELMDRFRPPSYPYTVIVGRHGKILAIPAPEEITGENMENWLRQQKMADSSVSTMTETRPPPILSLQRSEERMKPSQNKLVQLSQDFMYAAKTGEETGRYITQLRIISPEELGLSLPTDKEKKAFWINLYNAYTQTALIYDPGQYTKRGRFFGNRQFNIAGYMFSLDDIEHGILRHSRIKWSLGYLGKPFPGKTEKLLRVSRLDYRIHFALNCGAKSCPPIAFYRSEQIDQQLDAATKAYLMEESVYDDKKNTVELPALMSWFRRDFGGKKKMIGLLQQLLLIPAGKKPVIRFKTYDWTLYLQHTK